MTKYEAIELYRQLGVKNTPRTRVANALLAYCELQGYCLTHEESSGDWVIFVGDKNGREIARVL